MINGFPPIMPVDAKVLILGSMPGIESLKVQQYYGNPRNAFWWIMSELFDIAENLPYKKRIECLANEKIALWDVIASCRRKGSLDSAIEMETVKCNDFKSLLNACPEISSILLNGKTAENLFKRFVIKPGLVKRDNYQIIQLPSTSPANARISKATKLMQWQHAISCLR